MSQKRGKIHLIINEGTNPMPTDKLKQPDLFPLTYASTLSKGIGEYILISDTSKAKCKLTARKYRAFLNSIPLYPLHPLNRVLKVFSVRTRVKKLSSGRYYLLIIVNKKLDWESFTTPTK